LKFCSKNPAIFQIFFLKKSGKSFVKITKILSFAQKSVLFSDFLLSTYEIWKVLVSFAKKKLFIANFHVLGLFIPKKRV
jgi:hypothetical protein